MSAEVVPPAGELPLAEAAKLLKVHPSSVKRALGKIPIRGARKNAAGAWRVTPEAVDVLRLVQAHQKAGHSFESTRALLPPEVLDDEAELVTEDARAATEREPSDEREEGDGVDVEDLVARVVTALRGDVDLAQRYAAVARQVGGLEERLAATEAERDRLAAMLPDPGALARLQAEAEASADRAASERARREAAEARAVEVAAERDRLLDELAARAGAARPWWRRLLG